MRLNALSECTIAFAHMTGVNGKIRDTHTLAEMAAKRASTYIVCSFGLLSFLWPEGIDPHLNIPKKNTHRIIIMIVIEEKTKLDIM